MKFVMPNKRLLAVAIAAGLVAVFPLFVVLAAQGQITEVNPSGVSGVQAIVTVGTGEDVRELNINAKTTWKAVPGKGKNRAVNASFSFSVAEAGGDGSPVFVCKEGGGSLAAAVDRCIDDLRAAEDEDLTELIPRVEKFRDAALHGLDAFGIDPATYFTSTGTTGGEIAP